MIAEVKNYNTPLTSKIIDKEISKTIGLDWMELHQMSIGW